MSRPRPAIARPATSIEPAADAAALLRRLGFATLLLLLPIAAVLTRRAVVVLAPIAIVLLVIAAALDGAHRPLGTMSARLYRSPAFLAGALALGWCALSLAWTPFPGPALERLANLAATLGIAVGGFLALPDRMRSANLYLLPVGVGIAALGAIGFELLGASGGRREDDGSSLERGLVVLSLVVWPAIAWLFSRRRTVEAFGVGALVALATVFAPQAWSGIALAAGGVAFALTTMHRRAGMLATAIILPGLVALAPAVPFLLKPLAAAIAGPTSPAAVSLGIWRRIVTSEPVRLITGHGLETALRGRFAGLLPANAPSSLLFELWFELGIVGALAVAAALLAAILGAGRGQPRTLVPSLMGAFATAFAFACLGMGVATSWWIASLAVVIVLFVAVERGQFRTTRPTLGLLRAANDH